MTESGCKSVIARGIWRSSGGWTRENLSGGALGDQFRPDGLFERREPSLQHPLASYSVSEHNFVGRDRLPEFVDLASEPDPYAQFLGLERFGDEVVRSGAHAGENIGGAVSGREQNQIHTGGRGVAPHFAAQLWTRHAGHYPVENGQNRAITALQLSPRRVAILRRADLIL